MMRPYSMLLGLARDMELLLEPAASEAGLLRFHWSQRACPWLFPIRIIGQLEVNPFVRVRSACRVLGSGGCVHGSLSGQMYSAEHVFASIEHATSRMNSSLCARPSVIQTSNPQCLNGA
jgi:hypothetical protein